MTDKKNELVAKILEHWNAPLEFDPEFYRAKFEAKYQRPEDLWKIDFYIGRKREGHKRILASAKKIADMAEKIMS